MAILTVSKQLGSGATEIIEGVTAATGYEYLDRMGMLDEVKRQGPECEKWLKGFSEYFPEVWERYNWSFRGFVAVVQSIILNHAARDRVIIDGMGGGFLLRRFPHVLRLLIKAPMEARITRVQERDEKIDTEIARWLIERSDEETGHAEYSIYGRHWNDPAEYDMVVDTTARPTSQIVDDIQEGLKRADTHDTEAVRNAAKLQALAAKLKALIAINPEFDVTTLEVEPREPGLPEYGIAVKGVVRDEEDIEPIRELAKKVIGDMPLEFNLLYKWYPRIGPWQFK